MPALFIAILGFAKEVIPKMLHNGNEIKSAVVDNPKTVLAAFLTASIALAANYGYEVPPVWVEWLTTACGALAVLYALGGKKA